MPPDILDRIIEELLPRVFRVDLVGDGEILLVPSHVERILKAARTHRVLVNASTNGVLLTEDMSEMLVSLGLTDLNVSMDASTSDTFREIRGADFDRVIRNIETLNRIKQRHDSEFPRLQFSMVGMKRNIHELPGLVDLAVRHNAQSVMLQAMGEFEKVNDESVYLRDKALGHKWLKTARSVATQSSVQLHLWPEGQFGNDTGSDPEHPGERDPVDSIRLKDCGFPWDVPYFATDGSVRPCCAMPPMGNLHAQSFSEIWHGENYTNLRKSLNTPAPPQECLICPGRGWFTPEPCSNRLIPGTHDRQFGTGWFETEEYNGEYYRWARDRSVFFIQGSGPAVLEVEIHTVWDPGTTQEIDIRVDDEAIHRSMFEYGERRKVYLPVLNRGTLHAVTLSGKTWRPATTVPGERDPRALSVMFYGATLHQMPGTAAFANGIKLMGWSVSKSGNTELHVDLYWDIPSGFDQDIGVFIHGFPAPGPLKSIRYRMHELRRRRLEDARRFQLDTALAAPDYPDELTVQSCTIAIPDKAPGRYALYLGLRDKARDQRVPVSRCSRPTYRSAVELTIIKEQER